MARSRTGKNSYFAQAEISPLPRSWAFLFFRWRNYGQRQAWSSCCGERFALEGFVEFTPGFDRGFFDGFDHIRFTQFSVVNSKQPYGAFELTSHKSDAREILSAANKFLNPPYSSLNVSVLILIHPLLYFIKHCAIGCCDLFYF
jgi:hypothetical protein